MIVKHWSRAAAARPGRSDEVSGGGRVKLLNVQHMSRADLGAREVSGGGRVKLLNVQHMSRADLEAREVSGGGRVKVMIVRKTR